MRRDRPFATVIIAAALAAIAVLPLAAAEDRTSNIDVILLVDKSLSMVDAEKDVKNYVAGEIIGPILVPGDRIIIETFYGRMDRLYAGTIRSEEDKAAIVRSLNAIVANGRFTDIGAALDRVKADLDELGAPERPKYVLLLTDERQEAPAGSRYFAPDFKLVHPSLQYVRRLDMGSFRAITIGYDVGARIDATAPGVMRLLSELPPRKAEDFPALPDGTDSGLGGAFSDKVKVQKTTLPGQAGQTTGGVISPALGAGAAGLALILIAAMIIFVVRSRNRRRKDEGMHDAR